MQITHSLAALGVCAAIVLQPTFAEARSGGSGHGSHGGGSHSAGSRSGGSHSSGKHSGSHHASGTKASSTHEKSGKTAGSTSSPKQANAGSRGSSGGDGTGNNPSSHSVRGYNKKDGTHVEPHRATDPNKTQRDNYSTKGNENPTTGKPGTKKAER